MQHYVALIHKDGNSEFGVSFPDFPGCISAGATLAEAMAMGFEALAGHVALMVENGEAVPEPSSIDDIMKDPENRNGVPVLIRAPPAGASRSSASM